MPISNRELAVAIWMVPVLILALSSKNSRHSVVQVGKLLFRPPILHILTSKGLYTVGVVVALRHAHLWTVDLAKDTVLWFLFSGVISGFTILTTPSAEVKWTKLLTDQLKVVILLEFLVNTYTFSLPVELVLIPVLTLLALFDVVIKSDPSQMRAGQFTTRLQVLIGLGILILAARSAIRDYTQLQTVDALRSLLLAPLLSILSIPLWYGLRLYIK